MKATKEKYIELYQKKVENDKWDYKRELHIKTKSEKYNIIKDFLAFSNFGGGYILIGVDENNNYSIVNTEKEIDPSVLGNSIEFNLGFNIKFEINYFEIRNEGISYHVGIIYIYPSSKILTCPKVLQGNNNKVIVGVNDILTRRNTSSTKANAEDINEITDRLYKKDNEEIIKSDKFPIFKNSNQKVNNLWNALNNDYIVNAENISITLRGILWFSKHSKIDFANLTGIEMKRFNNLLEGNIIPSLEELIRISNLVKLDLKFFFQSNIEGAEPFWKSDLVRYSILKLVQPVSSISKVKDIDKILGSIVYETAKNIYFLYLLIFDYNKLLNYGQIDDIEIINTYKNISTTNKKKIIKELSHQHYKLLEQIRGLNLNDGYTKQEEMILLWHFRNSEYLARIFTEAIKKIKIIDKENFNITFHFWEELKSKKIRGRSYDDKNIRMNFSKIRLKL